MYKHALTDAQWVRLWRFASLTTTIAQTAGEESAMLWQVRHWSFPYQVPI